jgi:nucleotide-binding universal stress UspA family protein
LTFRSILAAVDFSEQSRHALRWAVAFSARFGGRLTVVTAVEPLLAHAARSRFGIDLAKETAASLRAFVAATVPPTLAWAPSTEVKTSVGAAADVILSMAHAEAADLIVLGTHGLGGFRKLLLGSTTDRVLRRVDIPMLAVPLVGVEGVTLDAQGPRFADETIMAATDFSAPGNQAVECAARLASASHAPLVLAHVVTPVTVPLQWNAYVEGLEEGAMAQAQTRLKETALALSHTTPPRVVVTVDRPADGIADIAQEQHAGLIVLGKVGSSEEPGPRPGSIAYRVLCLSSAAVLVVPPDQNRPS